mgnify:FL=1
MTSRLVLAPQETHDPLRQQMMRDRASKTVQNIRDQEGILGMVLSGSTARGPVGQSSDLDLHVIVSDKFTGNLHEWTFHGDGIIENLHTVHEDELLRGWNVRNESDRLATWFYETKLGDELNQFIPLWWNPTTQWREKLLILVAYRQNPDVAQRVARCYTESARANMIQAHDACHEDAPLDGHHYLRLAFQATLIAALIQRGWTIRGSKKRIEIAQAFLPDPVIENLLTIGLDIVGLKNMTANQVTKLCELRLQYRTTLLRELRKLEVRYAHDERIAHKLEQAIRLQEAHEAMAYDYYSPLVIENIIIGPVNHIRCISGLMRAPELFISCLHEEEPWPIKKFIKLDILSRNIRDAWLEIMALESSPQQCARLLSILSTTNDNLIRK